MNSTMILPINRDEHGQILNTLDNYVAIFKNDPNLSAVCFNEITGSIEVKGTLPWNRFSREWSDADYANLLWYLERCYQLYSPRKCREAFEAYITSNRSYNPVKDRIESVKWDGIERLETLLVDYLGAEDTPYVRAVTVKTMVAAVSRVYCPGMKFDYVLVLCGEQGIGKSTLFAKLGQEWYSDSLTVSDMKDKTAAEKLRGIWIMEISELSGIKRVDVETVKAFISRSDDQFREPYATYVQTHPRKCILVGTTNTTDGFLRDITGNRRFWPVSVSGDSIKKAWNMTKDEVAQIWAEAYIKYKEEEETYLPPNLERMAIQQQKLAMESDPRLGIIEEYLTEHDKETVCLMEIWCECLMQERNLMRKRDALELEAILVQLGNWEVYRGNTTGKTRIPGYGVQKTFVRLDQESLMDQQVSESGGR